MKKRSVIQKNTCAQLSRTEANLYYFFAIPDVESAFDVGLSSWATVRSGLSVDSTIRWMRPPMGWGSGGSAGSSTRISGLHGAEWLVELRGFEPMAIAGAERANPLPPVNARGLLAARAFLIAIDARASVFSFWRRSQAWQRSPRNKLGSSRIRLFRYETLMPEVDED
jgi:hypothetical protein